MLVALLQHPNAWHRDTAHRLLYERQDRSAVPALRETLRAGEEPLGRLHALWSLDGLDSLSDDDLLVALGHHSPGLREHAVLLAEPRLAKSDALRGRVVALADDPAVRVRIQVAFTLGEVAESDPSAVRALARIARRDAGDVWVRTAILSSSARVAGPLFDAVVAGGPAADPGVRTMLRALAGLVGASGDLRASGLLLDRLADGPFAGGPPEVLEEVLLGLGEGLARAGRSTVREVPVDSRARNLVSSVLKGAATAAADQRADADRRERAVTVLGQAGFVASRDVLVPLLAPRQPQRVQLAAVRSLTATSEPEAAALLLARWSSFSPALRSEVIARLLSRPAWSTALLDGVAAGTVPAAVIPPNRRALLLADRDPATRSRARSLFGASSPGPRSEAYARYRPALALPADRARGERVFERECMTCHKLGERGHAVGPNLSSVQRRTPDEILLHVLDPNREVSPEFLEYAVSLTDGRILTGLIASESAGSLTLRRAEGAEETVLRSQIEAISGTGKSLMPEGLEAKISPREMADLIAFLLTLQQ
jgi:putative heme-binding domain-containing protein